MTYAVLCLWSTTLCLRRTRVYDVIHIYGDGKKFWMGVYIYFCGSCPPYPTPLARIICTHKSVLTYFDTCQEKQCSICVGDIRRTMYTVRLFAIHSHIITLMRRIQRNIALWCGLVCVLVYVQCYLKHRRQLLIMLYHGAYLLNRSESPCLVMCIL